MDDDGPDRAAFHSAVFPFFSASNPLGFIFWVILEQIPVAANKEIVSEWKLTAKRPGREGPVTINDVQFMRDWT